MVKDADNQSNPDHGPLLHNPIRINDVWRGSVPLQPGFDYEARIDYQWLSTCTITPHINTFDDYNEITIAGPLHSGSDLQHLFHFAAPSKKYRYDFEDTQNDWEQLYTDPVHAERLKHHQRIPEWDMFELYREELRTFIGNDFDAGGTIKKFVVPVVRIRQNKDEMKWEFSTLDEKLEKLFREIMQTHDVDNVTYVPALGPAFLAAFSPKIMSEWGPRLTYGLKSTGPGQDMGSTQAFALSLAIAESLLSSPFLDKMIRYAETGIVPMATSEEPQKEGITPVPLSKDIYYFKDPDIG